MRLLLLFLLLLLVIGGGLKLAGMQIPILDYPLGGPFTQPDIEIVHRSQSPLRRGMQRAGGASAHCRYSEPGAAGFERSRAMSASTII